MKENETVGESCAESSEESVRKHYEQMVPNNVAFVKEAKAAGRPIVGIYCEFTPRELILAAGGGAGLPVWDFGEDHTGG